MVPLIQNLRYKAIWCALLLCVSGLYAHGESDHPGAEILEDVDGVILVINSYRSGYSWTDRQVDGLRDQLDGESVRNRLFLEYLDSKRIAWKDNFRSYIAYLDAKYDRRSITTLVAMDDYALQCAVAYREAINPELPIFFSGINAYTDEDIPVVENSTGMIERLDAQETVDFALRSFKDIRKIWVLSEYTLSGDLLAEGLQNQLVLPEGVELIRIKDRPFADQVKELSKLGKDSIIYVLPYRRDSTGKILEQSIALQTLAENIPVPMFIGYHFSICESIVGGKIIDSYDLGSALGKKLSLYLAGVPVKDIPVDQRTVHKWVFSKKGIERFGIRESSLPENYTLLFLDKVSILKFLIGLLIAIVFIAVQAFMILILLESRRRLKILTSELSESKSHLSSWIAHAPLPVCIFNHSGELVAINHQYTELLGYEKGNFKSDVEMWSILIQDESDRKHFLSTWEEYRRMDQEKSIIPQEIKVDNKSGGHKVIEVHISVIGDFLVCLFNDITWRFQIERELENALNQAFNANIAKTQFLANMSHEIRTPLNGVLGMANLLADSQLEEEQRSYVEIIQRSGEMLLLTINDILDLSKIESGQLDIERIPFDLRKCVEDGISVCLPKLDSDNVTFTRSIDGSLPSTILGDGFRVSQIIVNLLSNAFKYTQHGTVVLSVRATPLEDDQLRISIEVRDTGTGIPVDKQKAIFEPFTQADTSITRRYGGTGLGLTICKRLSDKMGGEINLSSSPGVGSTFEFTWVTEAAVRPDSATDITPAKIQSELSDSGIKTLVVEDNTVNYKVIELSLKKLGIKTSRAKNGLEGVEMLKEDRFDLVFMDIQMPVMDGLKATSAIRDEIGQKQQPFIVALTAHALADHIEQCRKVRMNGFLAKPFTSDELKKMINLYLEEKESDRYKVYF